MEHSLHLGYLGTELHSLFQIFQGDFPGGTVVKVSSFHYRGRGFSPWSGTKIS